MERTAASVIIARARQRTDTVTPSPTTDFITDAALADILTTAYRRLIDMVLSASGESGIDLYATSVTLAAGVTALPNQMHRLIDVRKYNGFDYQPLTTANWRTRHRAGTVEWPCYTVVNGNLVFDPPNASPGELQIWYIPTLDFFADLDYLTVNGWDEYLVAYLSREIAVKSDLPTGDHADLLKESEKRIKDAARDLKMGHTKTLAAVEVYPEDYFGRWY